MADSVESLENVKKHCTYVNTSWWREPYNTCEDSGGEEFGLSGMGGIQTEEGRSGCGCGDVVKAGYERASRELCWELGEEKWDGSLWVRHGHHLCEEACQGSGGEEKVCMRHMSNCTRSLESHHSFTLYPVKEDIIHLWEGTQKQLLHMSTHHLRQPHAHT